MGFQFFIEGKFPSINTIINKSKQHWAVYKKLKEEQTERVVEYIELLQSAENGIPAYDYVDIHIHWIEKNRRRDKDNIIAGGLKFILDGIVKAGILEDDNWHCVRNIYNTFSIDKAQPRISIHIKEVEK